MESQNYSITPSRQAMCGTGVCTLELMPLQTTHRFNHAACNYQRRLGVLARCCFEIENNRNTGTQSNQSNQHDATTQIASV